jgi:hypothetical protein
MHIISFCDILKQIYDTLALKDMLVINSLYKTLIFFDEETGLERLRDSPKVIYQWINGRACLHLDYTSYLVLCPLHQSPRVNPIQTTSI